LAQALLQNTKPWQAQTAFKPERLSARRGKAETVEDALPRDTNSRFAQAEVLDAAEDVSKLNLKNKVIFFRAEASECPTIANRPSVPGFPTIVGVFQNGKEFPYAGPRTKDSFVKFAELIAIGGLDPPPSNGTGLVVGEPPVVKLKPRKLTSFYDSVQSPTDDKTSESLAASVQAVEELVETVETPLRRVPTASEDFEDKDETVIQTPMEVVEESPPLLTKVETQTTPDVKSEEFENDLKEELADQTVLPNTPLQSTGTVETHARTRKGKKEIKL
jgi:hypothetical protein